MTETFTMADLEAAMHGTSGKRPAKLPAKLEAAFERERKNDLASAALFLALRSAVIYNIFLPLEFVLLPKTAWLAVFLHLCVVTPYMVAVCLILRRQPNVILRDSLGMVFPVLVVAQIMLIYRLNAGIQAADQYQYMATIVMVYTNNNQVLNMRFAIAAVIATAALYLVVLFGAPSPPSLRIVGTTMIISAAVLSLESKSRLERSARQNFLRRMYDRLQRREAENEASRDPLTGLSNRRHFDDRIATLNDTTRAPKAAALIMIDIDHFKLFNDRYGHPAGDHCLKRVGGVLAAALRGRQDLAIRYGGEEFLLLLPETPLDAAIQVAERVRRAIETMAVPHETSPTSNHVTASIGVAAGPLDGNLETLLAHADAALYKSKHAGRNQVQPRFTTREAIATAAWRTGR
jgi:diguanylate cyclase (GGDEF)-like protein